MTAVEVRSWDLWEPFGRQLAKSRAIVLTAAKTQLKSTSALVALVAPCLLHPRVLRAGGLCVGRWLYGGRTGVRTLSKHPGSVMVMLLHIWDAPEE